MTPLPSTVEVLCDGAADRSLTHARYLGRRTVVCEAMIDPRPVQVGRYEVLPAEGQLAAFDHRNRPWIAVESAAGPNLVRLGAPSTVIELGPFGESPTVEFIAGPIWVAGGTLQEKRTAGPGVRAPFVGDPLCETSTHYLVSGSRAPGERLQAVWTLDKASLTRAEVLVPAAEQVGHGCVRARFAVTATDRELQWTSIDGPSGFLALPASPRPPLAAVSRHDLVLWQYPGFASVHWLRLGRRGQVSGMGSAVLRN